jgi:hypothetical protein
VGEHPSASQKNQEVKLALEVDGAKEFYDLDQSLLFGLDTGRQRAILRAYSKLLKQHQKHCEIRLC